MLLGSPVPRIVVVALFALAALPCFADDVAVLKNGFSIRHERRQVLGDITRLYVNADGSSFVDIPTAEIEHFEAEESAPPVLSPQTAKTTDGAIQSQSFRPGSIVRPSSDVNQLVTDASGRYHLDPDLVKSVIQAESGFNVRAVSPKGAQGLMQLMPGTASQLGVPNSFDPQANVEGGTRYLRELLERYNFDLLKALAAYNAGPQKVERYKGIPPYFETRAYVARVVRDFNKKKVAQEKAAATKKRATVVHAGTKTKNATKAAKKPVEQAKAGTPSE